MSIKKTPLKVQQPQPKYSVGATVFYIIYHKSKPESLVECKVTAQHISRTRGRDFLGKVGVVDIYFSYNVDMPLGSDMYALTHNLPETQLYPNYTEAAKAFSKPFLTLLK